MDSARSVLEEANYRTQISDISECTFYFEDNSLLGFVSIYGTFQHFHDTWKDHQDRFLEDKAKMLRSEPLKAWNVYGVYIIEEDCPQSQIHQIINIEENLIGLRKIVRTGVKTNLDVKYALLPLLPIQNLTTVQEEEALKHLRDRLTAAKSPIVELLDIATPQELAKSLIDRQ